MEAIITYYRYFYSHMTSQNPKQPTLHAKTHLNSLQKLIHIRNASYLFSGGGGGGRAKATKCVQLFC